MSYGAQFINGQNIIILGDGTEPYIISEMQTVGLRNDWGSWDEWGNHQGVKIGDITIPRADCIVFFPWNGSIRGGAICDSYVDLGGANKRRCYVHTDEGSCRVAIATPLKYVSGYRVYNGDFGLIVYNSSGQRIYDSRVPVVQLCGRYVGRSIARGQGVGFSSGGGNYVAQHAVDIGIASEVWAEGFLRRTGQDSAVMSKGKTEWIDDWGGSYPANLASQSQTYLIFAKIHL